MSIQITKSDALSFLKTLEDNSIDCALYDPPYFMGKKPFVNEKKKYTRLVEAWDNQWNSIEEYLEWCEQWIIETKRVLKPGGSFLVFGSYHCAFDTHILMRKHLDFRSFVTWQVSNCLSGSTVLYASTHKGVGKHMLKDLVRLDPKSVKLWDGSKWNQVVRWHETGKVDEHIFFRMANGEYVNCTKDHLFPINGLLKRAIDLKLGDVVDVCSLPEGDLNPSGITDEVGWFIGLYVAEGSFGDHGKCIQITQHEQESFRLERLRALAESFGGTCNLYHVAKNTITLNITSKVLTAFINEFVDGHDAHDKHFTQKFWRMRNSFIKSSLHGYLDGDGHKEQTRWRLGFCRNNYLASDLRTMCARIGYSIHLQHRVSEDGLLGYGGDIRDHNGKRFVKDSQIVELNTRKYRCNFWDIVVEEAPHLFSLASGVLSHNCPPIFMAKQSGMYAYSCQYINYFSKGRVAFFDYDYLKSENDGKQQRDFIIHPNKPTSERVGHPSQKPLKLIERLVKAHCPEDGIVLDIFSGSGTVALACKNTNRSNISCEISDEYYDMILKRLQ